MKPFGKIIENIPYALGKSINGILEFTPEIATASKDSILFVIDTGFTGYISIPSKQIGILKTKPIGQEEFELADKRVITSSLYLGTAKFGGITQNISIIPGKGLIGMGFISKFFTEIKFDLTDEFVYVTIKK